MDSTRSQKIKAFLFRNYFTMATAVFPFFAICEKCNTICSTDERNFPLMTISPNQSISRQTDK